uniref:Delta-conotoxin SuVIA n=1 Tax=Conus suturatus TaxID=1519877 RepID=O16A_CONSC|nr:RecName: Full=Delta-conotoxin SuVIA; Short=Delta-SuVIA [Conus suturatus]
CAGIGSFCGLPGLVDCCSDRCFIVCLP